MKKYSILIAIALFFTIYSFGQNKISIDDASKHYGETVTICDKVYGGRYFENSKSQLTLLNIGGVYPGQKLTIHINPENRKNFKDKPEESYLNKNVCVTGKVIEFNGKPEIVISKPDEINIQSGGGDSGEIKPNDFMKFQ